MSWLYLRWSRRTRLLLTCGDEILLVDNWLGPGELNLPGGGLHKGEDPRAGLLREVLEETGILLDTDTVSLSATEIFRAKGFRYRCYYFTATLEAKPATVPQPFEILGVTWLKRSEVSPETCGPDVFRALELSNAAPLDRP